MKDLEQLPVAVFLKEFKKIIQAGRFLFINRKKNKETLTRLGITKTNVFNIVLGLSVEDYCSGPEQDDSDQRPGDIWIFGTEVFGEDIYIKLKIFQARGQRHVKCISFHGPEYPLKQPWK